LTISALKKKTFGIPSREWIEAPENGKSVTGKGLLANQSANHEDQDLNHIQIFNN